MLDETTRRIVALAQGDASWNGDALDRSGWLKLLKSASLNRVLYTVASTLATVSSQESHCSDLQEILKVGRSYLLRQQATLKAIEAALTPRGIPYLIIKSYSEFLHTTWDIDLIVPPGAFESAVASLKVELGNPQERRAHAQVDLMSSPEFLVVDVHTGPLWVGDEYIETSLIWEKPRRSSFEGIEFPLPDSSAEVAVLIAHILHERMHVTLMEYFCLRQLAPQVDWGAVAGQAQKYGWWNSLLRFAAVANHLHRHLGAHEGAGRGAESKELIPTASMGKGRRGDVRLLAGGVLRMPYVYPAPYALEIFVDRLRSGHFSRVIEFSPYYFYALLRYNYRRRLRVPIYDHWFPFRLLEREAQK